MRLSWMHQTPQRHFQIEIGGVCKGRLPLFSPDNAFIISAWIIIYKFVFGLVLVPRISFSCSSLLSIRNEPPRHRKSILSARIKRKDLKGKYSNHVQQIGANTI